MHPIVVDLSYGDSGKGTGVDWLVATQPVGAVVRFNGGAQAAHNVVLPSGQHHTFSQFGSGLLARSIITYLSAHMLVEPFALMAEAEHLQALGITNPLKLVVVDRDALITTWFHRAANQARELARGAARHGSCGIGIAETMMYALAHPNDAIYARDLDSPRRLAGKLTDLRDCLEAELGPLSGPDGSRPTIDDLVIGYREFAQQVRIVDQSYLKDLLEHTNVVFEGAQGVLLDEWRGFHPHTTWSTTTFDNAERLLVECGHGGEGYRIGVTRTYATRHGAGPFPTEDPALTLDLPDTHNVHGAWQGAFRVGHFDAVTARYALAACGGADGLLVTHLDVAEARDDLRICTSYEIDGQCISDIELGPYRDLEHQANLTDQLWKARANLENPGCGWIEAIEAVCNVPVIAGSWGMTSADKRRITAGRR